MFFFCLKTHFGPSCVYDPLEDSAMIPDAPRIPLHENIQNVLGIFEIILSCHSHMKVIFQAIMDALRSKMRIKNELTRALLAEFVGTALLLVSSQRKSI